MSKLTAARAAWGNDLPEWVAVLARACDDTSQNRVAKRLNRSASLVSQVLSRKYPGDLRTVEDIVRGALMAETLDCPALGEIGLDRCLGWRERARSTAPKNPLTLRMFRTCRTCPVNQKGDAE